MDVGVKYVLEGARKTEQNIEITTRALVIYHHFMRSAGDVFYDASVVAAAALYLSSRVSEKDIDIDTIVILFYHIVNKTLNDVTLDSMKFKVLRQSFITMTFLMQRMLEFTLKYRIAHEFFGPFLTCLLPRARLIKGFRETMRETCLSFMSDFYTNKICLNYKPEHIAIASMDAALRIYGFLVDLEVIEPWYEGFCTDLTEDKVEEIKLHILKLYKGEERMRPTSLFLKSSSAVEPSSQKKRKIAQVSDVQSSSKSKSRRPSSELNSTSCSNAPSLSSIEIVPSPTNRSSSPIEIVLSPPGGSVYPLKTISSSESSSSRSSSSGSSSSGSSSSESSSDRSFVDGSSSKLERNPLALDRPFSHLGRTSTDTPVILAERPSSQLENISSDEDDVETASLSTSNKTFTQLERTSSPSDRPSPLEEISSFPKRPSSQLKEVLCPQLEETSSLLETPSSQLEGDLCPQLEKTASLSERSSSSDGPLHTQLEKDSSLSETTLSEKPSSPSDKPSFQLEKASLPSETSQLEKTSTSLDKPSSENLSSKLETDRPSSELEDISSSSTEEGEISD
ncbi:uncharacterized protein TNIN_101001 [Trichonephila inaurata madagascariensis]|uniref:Cyclin-like domain-containing protein n=1 Tax=Trichonephila inaurata madagascariensis TaxID=2747483 RepID=A0A8X6Y4Q0_9ARAC|nr:uncharacterized protein TNIN_101001 [Trichonephila inaurata madagascariensis]